MRASAAGLKGTNMRTCTNGSFSSMNESKTNTTSTTKNNNKT